MRMITTVRLVTLCAKYHQYSHTAPFVRFGSSDHSFPARQITGQTQYLQRFHQKQLGRAIWIHPVVPYLQWRGHQLADLFAMGPARVAQLACHSWGRHWEKVQRTATKQTPHVSACPEIRSLQGPCRHTRVACMRIQHVAAPRTTILSRKLHVMMHMLFASKHAICR